jgi:hypothetical protein
MKHCYNFNCENLTDNAKYCSRACSASITNSEKPKRVKPELVSCKTCSEKISRSTVFRNVYCSQACSTAKDILNSLSVDQFALFVSDSISWGELTRRIDNQQVPAKRIGQQARRLVSFLELDVSHFLGQGWSKGNISVTLEEFEKVSKEYRHNTGWIKNALYVLGLKDKICEWCKNTEWLGQPIPLTLDHINGDNHDNSLENLRILCENCHALTPTWRGRNIKNKRKRM